MNSFVNIRLMKNNEADIVLNLLKSSFPLTHSMFCNLTRHVLVAEFKGKIIGGVVLKMFNITKKKLGMISWIFTTKEARGKGIASKLVDKSISYLKKRGCREILACIDGLNTASSKLFAKKKFRANSLFTQIKRWGLDYFSVLKESNQLFSLGSFVWTYPKKSLKEHKWFDVSISIFSNFLIGLLIFLSPLSFWIKSSLLGIFFSLVLIHLVRFFSAKIASFNLKTKVLFRSWPSGYFFSLFLGIFGVYFPMPGNFYPKRSTWVYQKYKNSLAKISISAVSGLLLLVGVSSYFASSIAFFNTLKYLGLSVLLFDLLLVFHPFKNLNGRRIYDYNKTTWFLFLLASISLFFL